MIVPLRVIEELYHYAFPSAPIPNYTSTLGTPSRTSGTIAAKATPRVTLFSFEK
jgi:hypothetical protein